MYSSFVALYLLFSPDLTRNAVARKVNVTVTTFAADPGSNGLCQTIGDQGCLTAAADVDTTNVTWTSETGVTIRVEIRTDDHPGK